jgi:hypothetical protein
MDTRRLGWPLILVAAAAVALAGCTGVGPTDAPATPPPTADANPVAATPEPTDPIEAIIDGDWRRVPVDPTKSSRMDPVDRACRAAEPEIGLVSIADVDARGQGRLILVYASGPSGAAWTCLATVAAGEAPSVSVVRLEASAGPIGDDELDAVDYRVTEFSDGLQAVVLIGRVGAHGVKVITQFDGDESFIYGSKGDGWYAAWWPGSRSIGHVSMTDIHNFVITGIEPALP